MGCQLHVYYSKPSAHYENNLYNRPSWLNLNHKLHPRRNKNYNNVAKQSNMETNRLIYARETKVLVLFCGPPNNSAQTALCMYLQIDRKVHQLKKLQCAKIRASTKHTHMKTNATRVVDVFSFDRVYCVTNTVEDMFQVICFQRMCLCRCKRQSKLKFIQDGRC